MSDGLPPGNSAQPHLFGIGGAHLDRRGDIAGDFVPGASNPGRMREEVGGGVFNALRSATQRGVSASLHSVRGGDGGGEAVAAAIRTAGIADLSAIFLDRATPSYTALIDRYGEPVAALADMELYETGFPRQIRRAKLRDEIAKADAILCDANLPAAALETLCGTAGSTPVFAIAISPAKVVRMRHVLSRLACLFMNRREADALVGRPSETMGERLGRLSGIGSRGAVVTDGLDGIGCLTGEDRFMLRPPPAEKVIDATGAGDAFAGAATAAMLHGEPLPRALREGAAAAMLTVQSLTSVPRLMRKDFAATLALVPEPESLD